MQPFTKRVKQKGWLMKQLAERWGLTPRQMSNIANDPKPVHWDALSGIPEKEKR